MKKFLYFFLMPTMLLVSVFLWWQQQDRFDDEPQVLRAEPAPLLNEIAHDQKLGNLLAIQPWMGTHDYANAATLIQKLDSYLNAAKQAGWLNEKTIVVWPEFIGTWLVAAHEKRSAFDAEFMHEAMTTVALTHLPEFLQWMWSAPDVSDTAAWSIFTLKSAEMARDYQTVFSTLAKRYQVTMVAGSIVLPSPSLNNDQLAVTAGASLYNISAVFDSNGAIIAPLVFKHYPIADELTFLSPAANDVVVHDTPAGKLGVLICADAWYTDRWQQLQKQGAELVAVPSYTAAQDSWLLPWAGYNPGPTPAEISPDDIGHITEADAWQKYAMTMRAPAAGIRHGVNVFLRGPLWELGSDGFTLSVSNGQAGAVNTQAQALLTSVWIQP